MMRLVFMLACFVLALPAFAADWSARAPEKPFGQTTPPPPDPEVLRQGGDTIADAVPLPLPAIDITGTTIGYTNDYYEDCPYGHSDSPDVVYSISPATDMILTVDLCGSSYDTHVFVYTEELVLHACNDDCYGGPPCGSYVSKIEYMPVTGGTGYFVVINGYGGQAGPYLLNITEFDPCELDCPLDAELEGEPPLIEDYVDLWNGGCNTDPFNAQVQPITGDAEFATHMFELGPQDCGEVAVVQLAEIGPCAEETLVITGEPGETDWFWVGPATFESPYYLPQITEYDYVLNLNLDVVAIENRSFSEVKALFD